MPRPRLFAVVFAVAFVISSLIIFGATSTITKVGTGGWLVAFGFVLLVSIIAGGVSQLEEVDW